MKKVCLLLFITLYSLNLFAQGKAIYFNEMSKLPKAKQGQYLSLVTNTLFIIEKVQPNLYSYKKSFSIFKSAWAATGYNCIYGSWPSRKVAISSTKSLCDRPHRRNQYYKDNFKNKCDKMGGLACNPGLFGEEALCIPLKSRNDVKNSTANCIEKFNHSNRTNEDVINQLKNKSDLQALFNQSVKALEQTCKNNNLKSYCDRFYAHLEKLKKQPVKSFKTKSIKTISPAKIEKVIIVPSNEKLVKDVEDLNKSISNKNDEKNCETQIDEKKFHNKNLSLRDESFEPQPYFCQRSGAKDFAHQDLNLLGDKKIQKNDNAEFSSRNIVDKNNDYKKVGVDNYIFERKALNSKSDAYSEGEAVDGEKLGQTRSWNLGSFQNGNISTLTITDYPVETESNKGKIVNRYMGNPPKTKIYTFFPRIYKPEAKLLNTDSEIIRYSLANGETIDLSTTTGKVVGGVMQENESTKTTKKWCRSSVAGGNCSREYSNASYNYTGNSVYVEEDNTYNHVPCEKHEAREIFAKKYRAWLDKYRDMILAGENPPERSPERICIKWRKTKFVDGSCVNKNKKLGKSTSSCSCTKIESRDLYNKEQGKCYHIPISDRKLDELLKEKCGFSIFKNGT